MGGSPAPLVGWKVDRVEAPEATVQSAVEDAICALSEKLHANIVVTDKLPPGVDAAIVTPAAKVTEIVLTEQQSEVIANAVAAPSKPLNRSAVESARKQNGDNAKKTAAALGLSFADFVKQLPTLGYVIVKGGKLQST